MSIIEDARRYRYLRDHVGSEWAESICGAEECDAAVDAMLAAQEAPGTVEPTTEWLSRIVDFLSGELRRGRRAVTSIDWAGKDLGVRDGYRMLEPDYPVSVTVEIVK